MKKILALLICAVMLLGLFAGCGNDVSDNGVINTTEASNGGADKVETPEEAGSLTVNAAAAITVTYGADGLVLKAEGINDDGVELLSVYEDVFGSSCADLISKFIKDSIANNCMYDTNYVVIKQNKGSALPGTNFLEGIQTAAQGALDAAEISAALVMVGEENLTADGYIDLVTAKVLVEKFLEVEEVTSFDGTDKPIDGMYVFDVAYDAMMERMMVDAETGGVSQGSTEELDQIIDDQEDNSAEETTPAESLAAEATAPQEEQTPEETTEETTEGTEAS